MAVTVQDNNIKQLNIDQLLLDMENPRLPRSIEHAEEPIFKYLARETSIEELMKAIGENNFFPGEPLIVCPNLENPDKYTVIEGNRRLTALRLLENPTLISPEIPRLRAIKELAVNALHKPNTVPVVVFNNREEVVVYLGHRHITGVKSWSSLSKARFLKQLFDSHSDTEKSNDERCKKIARSIGSRWDYVKRILSTLAIYKIIEDNDYFEIPNLDETNLPFSVFYTAFNHREIREFIQYPEDPVSNIEDINIYHLNELTEWICKKQTGGATVLINPSNLKKLAEVVSSPHALQELRGGTTLDVAYRRTEGHNKEFTLLLHETRSNLQSANAILAEVSLPESEHGRIEVTDAIEAIVKQARTLRQSWENLVMGEYED